MSELITCTHKVTLDIAKRDVCMIQVVFGDTANILEVNVCENGKEVSLENATLATIEYSNGTFDEMRISEDYKTASVRINANCLKQGLNFAQISIYSGENGLITAEMLTIDCNQKIGGENPSCPSEDMPKLYELIGQLVQQGIADGISTEQIADAVANYFTENPISETDPNVPEWAKAAEKPTYTAEEVGALSEETLVPAVNLALAQAKASGEFDGANGENGLTPTIGENGNWFLGETDTGKPSRGDKGDTGKTAYQYAQDGGYTGTEADFAAKLAAEIPSALSDLSEDETHRTVTDTEKETWNNKSDFSGNYDDLENKPTIPTVPEKLPNPNALTLTGAVNATYDGSEPVSVEIPSGGSEKQWEVLVEQEFTESAAYINDDFDFTKDEYLLGIYCPVLDAALSAGTTAMWLKSKNLFRNAAIGRTSYARTFIVYSRRVGTDRFLHQSGSADGAGSDESIKNLINSGSFTTFTAGFFCIAGIAESSSVHLLQITNEMPVGSKIMVWGR